MSSEDSSGVTLALVDPSLLSSWEEMVKRGVECSLMLKHSKGKVTAMLQCTLPAPSSTPSLIPSPSSAMRRKKRGRKEKRLKALLNYHQRLVVEKGLPPSRLSCSSRPLLLQLFPLHLCQSLAKPVEKLLSVTNVILYPNQRVV